MTNRIDEMLRKASALPIATLEVALKSSGEPVYAFRRKGMDDFCTCDERRYLELKGKPHLFEVEIFYRAAPPAQTPPPWLTWVELSTVVKKCRGYVNDDEMKIARAIETAVRNQFLGRDE